MLRNKMLKASCGVANRLFGQQSNFAIADMNSGVPRVKLVGSKTKKSCG